MKIDGSNFLTFHSSDSIDRRVIQYERYRLQWRPRHAFGNWTRRGWLPKFATPSRPYRCPSSGPQYFCVCLHRPGPQFAPNKRNAHGLGQVNSMATSLSSNTGHFPSWGVPQIFESCWKTNFFPVALHMSLGEDVALVRNLTQRTITLAGCFVVIVAQTSEVEEAIHQSFR